MDAVDERIVNELQVDARRSNKDLAAMCGVSPSTLLHRVRALEANGIIRGYHAEIDPAALGRKVDAFVSVRLQPKTPAAVSEFMDAIWALDETIAATMLTGAYDVLVHVSVRDVAALSETVLTAVANAPHVTDAQTSIIFEHRAKRVLSPLPERRATASRNPSSGLASDAT